MGRAADVQIWTNTALYDARDFKFLPAHTKTETHEQLAQRWIAKLRQGVEGKRVRFIKIGVNNGPLHPLDRKLVAGAILTSKATGLTIVVHTGDAKPCSIWQAAICWKGSCCRRIRDGTTWVSLAGDSLFGYSYIFKEFLPQLDRT